MTTIMSTMLSSSQRHGTSKIGSPVQSGPPKWKPDTFASSLEQASVCADALGAPQERLPPPAKSCPKHLHWALHFLKVFPKQSPGCSTIGMSNGPVNPKTHRKWVWTFINAIKELMDVMVRILFERILTM